MSQTTRDVIVTVLLLAFIIVLMWVYRNPTECKIDPTLERLRRDMIKVDPAASKFQWFPSDESFTLDKSQIHLCLKDPDTGKEYPYPQLVQVALHELCHAVTNVIDKQHTSAEWNACHNTLRKKAAEMGLFDPREAVSPGYCPKHD